MLSQWLYGSKELAAIIAAYAFHCAMLVVPLRKRNMLQGFLYILPAVWQDSSILVVIL